MTSDALRWDTPDDNLPRFMRVRRALQAENAKLPTSVERDADGRVVTRSQEPPTAALLDLENGEAA